MLNCSVAIQVLPLYSQEAQALDVVDKVIAFIDSKTDHYAVSAFETTIEGDYTEVMAIVTEAIRIAGEAHPDIFANIKVRYKADGQVLTIDEKTAKYHEHQ